MIYLISFIFGIIFGSFISVLVYRIKNKEKWILLWRSKCPNCNHKLSSLDLVPIFSYIFLWWKCRYCWKKISIVYPILELITWILFALSTFFLLKTFWLYYIYSHLYIVFYTWLVVVFMVAISFYDILFYEISFILFWILAFLLLFPQIIWFIWDVKLAIILWISWFLVFMWIIYLRKFFRKIDGMGGGDAIWVILLWFSLPILIDILQLNSYPIFLSFYVLVFSWFVIAGIVWIIFLILWKWKQFAIPFLPFMFLWLISFIIFWKYIIVFLTN